MYESRTTKPLPWLGFIGRVLRHFAAAMGLLIVSLGIGMWGYVGLESLSYVDAFLNSAMLLGGMGPVNNPNTTAGKLFAGVYALYAGMVFIITTALVLTPVAHRILHRFHWDDKV